jgi:hypothetical protein
MHPVGAEGSGLHEVFVPAQDHDPLVLEQC